MNSRPQRWQHQGGKLRELGAETLTAMVEVRDAAEPIKVR